MWLSVLSVLHTDILKKIIYLKAYALLQRLSWKITVVFVVNSCFKETLSKNKQIDRNVLSKKTWPFKCQDVHHLYWRARIAAKTFNGNADWGYVVCLVSTNTFEMNNLAHFAWSVYKKEVYNWTICWYN